MPPPAGWTDYGTWVGRETDASTAKQQRRKAWRRKVDFQRGKTAERDFGSTMPTYATMLNSMRAGEFFTVGGQRFKWRGRDATPVDADGNPTTAGSGLAAEFQKKMDEANAANEARYQQILGGYGTFETDIMGRIGQRYGQRATDIKRAGFEKEAAMRQDAVSRGLAGTTMPRAPAYGIHRETQGLLSELEDMKLGQEIGALAGIRGGKFGVMERKSEIAPDYGMLLRLAQGLGEAGGQGRGVFAAGHRPVVGVGVGAGAGGGGAPPLPPGDPGWNFGGGAPGAAPGGGQPAGMGGFRPRPALPAEPMPRPGEFPSRYDPVMPYRRAAPGGYGTGQFSDAPLSLYRRNPRRLLTGAGQGFRAAPSYSY